MRPFIAAGLDDGETEVLQNGMPTSTSTSSRTTRTTGCFRLVLEVTSSDWKDDLKTKVAAYAEAEIPVYVVVDRKHQRVHVLAEPAGGRYEYHRPHAPGELVTLPESIGAKVTLDVDQVLKAGQKKAN
jgi:Uma2 family endonuclease